MSGLISVHDPMKFKKGNWQEIVIIGLCIHVKWAEGLGECCTLMYNHTPVYDKVIVHMYDNVDVSFLKKFAKEGFPSILLRLRYPCPNVRLGFCGNHETQLFHILC